MRRFLERYAGQLWHPSVYFGLSMIAVIWLTTGNQLRIERDAGHRAVSQNNETLSMLLEENVVRTISEIDKILQFLRTSYELSNRRANWIDLVHNIYLGSELTVQIAVIDRDGRLIATNLERNEPHPIDLSDRAHFRVHQRSTTDTLYVSAPVLGRRSGRWSVQFTRRFTDAEGGFAGVLVASLDPGHFSEFMNSMHLGAGGSATLVGDDGIVRASGGQRAYSLGASLKGTPLLARMSIAPEGLLDEEATPGTNARITSFRMVRRYPLVVAVSADRDQPASSYLRNRESYLSVAVLLTAMALLAIWLGLLQQRRYDTARCALSASEQHLREKTRELELTLEHMSQGIIMVDANGNIPIVNDRCLILLGISKEALHYPLNYHEVVAAMQKNGEFSHGRGSVTSDVLDYIVHSVGAEPVAVYERTRPDGTILEVRSRALPDGGFVRTFTDITNRRRVEAKIVHLARHDPLTDLANRMLFRDELERALATEEGSNRGFALHLIDLDYFKAVNDTHGHQTGDKLLRQVAQRIRHTVRSNDIVARLGGDEFAILQMSVSDPVPAGRLADRLGKALARPFSIDGNHIAVGASIGVALAPADGNTSQQLLKAADLALYSAKADGRGNYRYYCSSMNATLQMRRNLDSELRHALERNEFELFYQPIRDLDADRISGYEALIRWRHPERGLVPPMEFIPAAEQNGLITAIGAWVLQTACTEIARQPGALRIAVNLSPVQFRSPDLVSTVRKALDASGLPPERLELEITESSLLDKNEQTHHQLQALNAMGVRIALDDFGTGYSSLSYLMSYPIDCIKIDRSFVTKLSEGAQSVSIVRAITDLASSLGMSTTAEGVETEEQLCQLLALGCSEAQGYLFSPPRPAADIFDLEPRQDEEEVARVA